MILTAVLLGICSFFSKSVFRATIAVIAVLAAFQFLG